MSSYPNRCQHLKTNGTQCGSPALRRNRFCYFHKRYQEERIRLGVDRRRRGTATFILPVLEDANSIQMSLMQIMRLLLTGQIEHKTASLLLYGLQTASANLRQTNFKPFVHEVILDPRDAADSLLEENHLWEDDDFEEEDDEVEREIQEKMEKAADVARVGARFDAEQEIKARERARKRFEQEEKAKLWVAKHPGHILIRRDGQLIIEQSPKEEPKPDKHWWETRSATTGSEIKKSAAASETEKTAAGSETGKTAAQVRAEITVQIRKDLPAITKGYQEGLKRKAENARKKPAARETRPDEAEGEAEAT